MTIDQTLVHLGKLVGTWTTEATHPMMPGVVVHGTTTIEWLEGKKFLIVRARTDHPDFPDAISILGHTEHDRVDEGTHEVVSTSADLPLRMHYFDERGVFRLLESSIDERAWRVWRESPGFSQRFTGTFADGDATISGVWQLCRDDVHWKDDLAIVYRRAG